MGNLEEEIRDEQRTVDGVYAVLDATRQRYRLRQRKAAAKGNIEQTPQNRSERDAVAAHYGDQAARLEQVEDSLVFGRLDAKISEASLRDDAPSPLYVGRVGLRDEADRQVLVDWRAPAALPFYQATPAHPMGMVRRRHIATKLREVIGLDDELLDREAGAAAGTVLQGEGALMAALSSARDGKMGDIVATIQAEQDRVIRHEGSGMMVVQGGPGTGKTAVALHRAAYLLYAKREVLEKAGVLVVGPSPAFLRYIEKVLPALGETGVVYQTLGTLLPTIRTSVRDEAKVAAVKGSLRMSKVCSKLVKHLRRLPQADQVITVNGVPVTLSIELVKQATAHAYAEGGPHNVAWKTYANYMVEALTAQYAGEKRGSESDWGWMREDIRSDIDIRRAVNLCWLPSSAQNLLEGFFANRQKLSRFFTPGEVELLYRPKGSPWTVEDIPLLDELEERLGPVPDSAAERAEHQRRAQQKAELELAAQAIRNQGLGGGLVNSQMLVERAGGEAEVITVADRAREDRTWTFGHIVVDEAQELSAMAWRMLLRRCPTRSFTVVGDLAQRSLEDGANDWSKVLGEAARALTHQAVLTISYRTPKTIMELADRVLVAGGRALPFPANPVRDEADCLSVLESTAARFESDLLALVQAELEWLSASYGSTQGQLAVICDDDAIADLLRILSQAGVTDSRLSLLTATQSKGLEYDSVIVVEPSAIAKRSLGGLYVGLTRPTHRLRVIHTGSLPAGFSD